MAAVRDLKASEMAAPGGGDAIELGKRHLIQPWPYAGSVGAEARALIGEGDGIYITDNTGKRLIDGPAGMWCVNVGHRREELARVMYDQAMALSYNTPWYTMNAPSAELAMRIAGHAPDDLSHVFYTTGGSSAVETALRFMQFYNNVRGRPEKKLILSRGGAYHGSTYLSASLNGRPRDRDWMDGADELVIKLSSPDPFRRPQGMSLAAFTDFLVDQFRDTVARDFNVEFFFKCHHQLNRIQAVCAKIVDKASFRYGLGFINAKMFNHDFLYAFSNIAHVGLPYVVKLGLDGDNSAMS